MLLFQDIDHYQATKIPTKLGVIFDRLLTFLKHANNAKCKILSRNNVLNTWQVAHEENIRKHWITPINLYEC